MKNQFLLKQYICFCLVVALVFANINVVAHADPTHTGPTNVGTVEETRAQGTVTLSADATEETDPKQVLDPLVDDAARAEKAEPVSENAPSDITKALLLGQEKSTYKFVTDVMRRLHFSNLGDKDYNVGISPIPFPNARIFPETRKTVVDIGLFSLTETTDEFAFIMAHEMTHGNPELLKALGDDVEVDRILSSIPEIQGLQATQREEIRADLGAVKRMIAAGYNPWAGYNIQFKFAKLTKDLKKKSLISGTFISMVRMVAQGSETYYSTHPDPAVRMLAIKAYIVYLSNQQDLSKVISNYERLPLGISVLRARAKVYAFAFTSKWLGRGLDFVFYKQMALPFIIGGLKSAATTFPAAYEYLNQNALLPLTPAFNAVRDAIPLFIRNGTLETDVTKAVLWAPWALAGAGLSFWAIKNPKKVWTGVKKVPGLVAKIPGGVKRAARWVMTRDPQLRDFERYRNALEKRERVELEPVVDYVNKNLEIIDARFSESINDDIGGGRGLLVSLARRAFNAKAYPRKLARNVLLVLNSFVKQAEPDQLDALRGMISPSQLSAIIRDQQLMADSADRTAAQDVLAALTSSDVPKVDYQGALDVLAELGVHNKKLNSLLGEKDLLEFRDLSKEEKEKAEADFDLAIKAQRLENSKDDMALLAVLTFAHDNFSKLGVEDKVTLLAALNMAKETHTAAILLKSNHQQLLSEIYSKNNSDPLLAKALDTVYDSISHLDNTDQIPNQKRDWRKTFQEVRSAKTKSGEYLDTLGVASEVKKLGATLDYGRFSRGRYLSKQDTKNFINYLEKNISSLTDLKKFVVNELVPRHVKIEAYSDELSALVLKHPEWIKNVDDIDVLTSEDYLWKTLNGENIRYGTVEAQIYNQIINLKGSYPEIWTHEPGRADQAHQLILQKLNDFGVQRTERGPMLALWTRLSAKGVTTTSDQLLSDMYEKYYKNAPLDERVGFASLILESHRIWEPALKDRLVIDYMTGDGNYQALLKTVPGADREELIQKVITRLYGVSEVHSTGTADFLENMSVKIRSTHAEADIIESAKYPKSGEKVEDAGLRSLSLMIDKVLDWKVKDQWDLILFLKGDIPATDKIKKAFELVGTERIRRTFMMLPTVPRAAFIDMILSDPRGINPSSKGIGANTHKIVKYILDQSTPESREVAEDIFDSLLYALRATGNTDLQNFYLSYMLSYPKSQFSRIGRVLREFLDQNGTLGRKLGQFIAAAEILPPEDTRDMRELQENASKPPRARVYKDMDATNDARLKNVELGEVLGGGASKYAAMIGLDKVFKQLRSETTARMNTEIAEVEAMANHLVKKNRRKYGVLKRLVEASVAAVRREIDPRHEVEMSRIAREMYHKLSTAKVRLECPKEELITDTTVLADFAKGVSIEKLSPSDKLVIAQTDLETEDKILYRDFDEHNLELSNSMEELFFDPDRHWGNSKNEIESVGADSVIHIRNLDFGQLQKTNVRERSYMLRLFALSQVLGETGSTKWAVTKISEIYSLDKKTSSRLSKTLGEYFPATGQPITLYYSLLSAIQDAGHPIGMEYYDFLRAQVQLNPSTNLLGESFSGSPLQKTERFVRRLVDKWRPEMRNHMTAQEKLKFWVRSKMQVASNSCSDILKKFSRRTSP